MNPNRPDPAPNMFANAVIAAYNRALQMTTAHMIPYDRPSKRPRKSRIRKVPGGWRVEWCDGDLQVNESFRTREEARRFREEL